MNPALVVRGGDSRALLNRVFDQPTDKEDYTISSVDTTQIFAPVMRLSLYHQY